MCSVDWKLVLEYLKVALSWPVVVGSGGLFVILRFTPQVRRLIERIATVKFPGGELSMPQLATLENEAPVAPAEEGSDSVSPDEAAAVEGQSDLSDREQIETLRAIAAQEIKIARIWQFRFFNYFFAPSTQEVLNWLILQNHQTTTTAIYQTAWAARITQPEERDAVLQALSMYDCIRQEGPFVRVTELGNEYARSPERKILGFQPRVPLAAGYPIPPAAA